MKRLSVSRVLVRLVVWQELMSVLWQRKCGREMWHSNVIIKGGQTRVFKITGLDALAIAFGKRQQRICEVKGGKACTNQRAHLN